MRKGKWQVWAAAVTGTALIAMAVSPLPGWEQVPADRDQVQAGVSLSTPAPSAAAAPTPAPSAAVTADPSSAPEPTAKPTKEPDCTGPVNINTAGLEELMTLPGIGEKRAQSILDYRAEYGPFQYPEEIYYVPGIGEGILENIIHLITAGGE